MNFEKELRDMKLIIRPLISALEVCSFTDPDGEYYIGKRLHEDHCMSTATKIREAMTCAVTVQFPQIPTVQAYTMVDAWEQRLEPDWRTFRIMLEEELVSLGVNT